MEFVKFFRCWRSLDRRLLSTQLPARLRLNLLRYWILSLSILLFGWVQTHPFFVTWAQSPGRNPGAFSGKIFRDKIRPNWISGQELWYEVTTGPSTSEFVFVDAVKQSRQTAASLDALQKLVGKDLTASPTMMPTALLPSTSSDNELIQVRFTNTTAAPVELYWFNAQRRPQLYHTVAPGESIAQNSFTGHTWFASNVSSDPSDKRVVWTKQLSIADRELAIAKTDLEIPFPRRRSREPSATRMTSPNGVWSASLSNNDLTFTNTSNPDRTWNTLELVDAGGLSLRGSASFGYSDQIHWSPDSRFAVLTQIQFGQHRELTLIESSPKDELQPRVIKQRYDKPGDALDRPTLRLIDFEAKTPTCISIDTALFPEPWSIDEVRWDADCKRFTFLYNQRGHQVLRVIAVDAATGKASAMVDEVSPTFIDYAAKAYHEYLDDSNEILWASERDGYYHLYLYDAGTGTLKNQVTRGNWVVRSIESVDRKNRCVWFYASGIDPNQDPYYRHLCRVQLDGSNFVRVTAGDGEHRCEFSPDRSYVIDSYSRVDRAPVHELRSTQDGELRVALETADVASLVEAGWNPPERFVAKGRDGVTDIYGIIVRPTEFEPGKKYPIIEDIYAGPQDSFVPKSFSLLNELRALADKGFIVVKIDGMGTSNRSKAFHDVSYRNLSDGGFPDRIRWIQAAAAKYPELDAERVGVYGGSAGGQNALAAMLFHGDFYDAAVADCGCHDNRMDKVWWNELYMGWPIGEHYEKNSNVVNAHRLQGKLFLIVGELDSNVDPSSTMQVVNALIKADKDFDLLVVPGGAHGVGSSPYGKRRRDDFFIRHLQPGKQP